MLSKATDCHAEHNDKDLKFKIGDHVRMLKKKNVFCKRLYAKIKIWSEEVFVIKKVKILYHGYTSSAISTNH